MSSSRGKIRQTSLLLVIKYPSSPKLVVYLLRCKATVRAHSPCPSVLPPWDLGWAWGGRGKVDMELMLLAVL